ncbi:MAG TPA: 2-C-methyl-D-erythritol 4-phosphate cytidylyltransferase [Pseudonocardiaceae bacterium]|jgi:2-C-methyl-D-erythritol 4-phosphate cytidylyltransferase|nr:2-C-methyl-D-erythritol 4-phosphate cytidylyltransferase [Pseudonocardiaceae bacterium]
MSRPVTRTSDGDVVALVSVTGRADALALMHALGQLADAGVTNRIVVATESEKDIRTLLPDDGSVRVVPDFAVADLDPDARVVLVHDPLRVLAPAELIRHVVATVLADDMPVVPVLPCSDTVKRLDADGFVIDTPNRAGLRVVQTPIGYPAALIRSGALQPGEVPVGARTVDGAPA